MKHCGNCANYDRQRKQHTDVCAACIIAYVNDERQEPSHWKCIPMTNADRIRAMSDEKLAAWMDKCNAYGERADANEWLTWLQQPAEDL